MPVKLPTLVPTAVNSRTIHRIQTTALDRLPSLIESDALVRSYKPFEIYHTTPELRFKESDQVAPAGEWRWQLATDIVRLQRSLTANYATTIDALTFARSGNFVQITMGAISRIHYDTGLEIWHDNVVETIYTTDSNGNAVGYNFGARNSSSVHSNVFAIRNATDPGGIDAPFAIFINRVPRSEYGIGGVPSVGNFQILSNPNNAGTVRRVIQTVGATNNGEGNVFQAVPQGNTPFATMRAEAAVPTTAHLDAEFLTFIVDGSDQLVAYFNKAGAIISLVIGTLA